MKHTFSCVLLVVLASASRAPAVDNPWDAPDLNPVTFHDTPKHSPVVLVDHGKPLATLCLMGHVDPKTVAELQTCIKLVTGTELPVLQNKIKNPAIVIGGPIQGVKFSPEMLAIRTSPQQVRLAGEGPGLNWAVYEFLERYVGVRWYFVGDIGRSTPKRDTLTVPPVFLTDAPVFRKREIWPPMGHPQNGTGVDLRPLHQALRSYDSWPVKLHVHSPIWSHVEDYTRNRPEIFQLTKDGKRNFEMLCYSNPKTLSTYLENIEKHFAGDASAVIGIEGDAITVSPNDDNVECYCPDCRKLWDEKAGQYGTASRTVGTFVVKLAKEVQRRWPGKKIIYLPYVNYTLAPDGLEFPANVHVQLCGMPGMANYKEPSIYESEQANVDKWVKLTGKKIQNWLYICWPQDRTKAVFQYPHVVQKYYRDNRDKTVGSFINGSGDHWPRQGLTLYCWLKVLWNPDFNVDAAIDEHCRRMYGPGAGTMRKLVQIQIDGWENSRWPDATLKWRAVYFHTYTRPIRDQMRELLAQARKEAAGDPLATDRIAYYTTPFADFFASSEDK